MRNGDCYKRIVDAATDLFAQQRFHEVTIDDIAAAARVGKGTIYRHFQDKDDLFFHAATDGFDTLCDHLDALATTPPADDSQLTEAAESIAAYFAARRLRIRPFSDGERSPNHNPDADSNLSLNSTHSSSRRQSRNKCCDRWKENRARLVQRMVALVDAEQSAGRIRNDVPADVLARMFLGMLRSRAMQFDDRSLNPTPAFVAAFFIRGAAPVDGSESTQRPASRPSAQQHAAIATQPGAVQPAASSPEPTASEL